MEVFGASDGKAGEKWPPLWCHRKSSSYPSPSIKKAVMCCARDFRVLEEHIPRLNIITQPFYNLLERNASWERTPQYEEALELLKQPLVPCVAPLATYTRTGILVTYAHKVQGKWQMLLEMAHGPCTPIPMLYGLVADHS